MPGVNWSETVEVAVRRLAARQGGAEFSLQQLIANELDRIVQETGSRGATPDATLRRELQQLRDQGQIAFLGRGNYRLLDAPFVLPRVASSKCVFVMGSHATEAEQSDRFYPFPARFLDTAARAMGQWVLFQESPEAGPRGYYAVARVEQIVRDPTKVGIFRALMVPGSYLELGRNVPLGPGEDIIAPIRPISDEDFDRIVGFGLIEEDEILPREDEDHLLSKGVREEQEPFIVPVDRATALVERKVRNRQFRKRVVDAYDQRCALTGIRLINGGGRAEVQAAHIMSVEAKGPDKVENGIALSGTVHWMFDRGLISLSDTGDILLSRKINDVASVEKLIYPDRRARLPAKEVRPHPRYLAWHREYHSFVV